MANKAERRMVKPVTPAEIAAATEIPDTVIEVFNELIAANYVQGKSVVLRDEVVRQLEDRGFLKNTIFRKRWLDIEALYIDAGWNVMYGDFDDDDTPYPVEFIFMGCKESQTN